MNRNIVWIILLGILVIVGLYAFVAYADTTPAPAVNALIPDPAKSQVTASMTGTLVFQKGAGGDVNITGWTWMKVNPSAQSTYYYNTDTTKTQTLPANTDTYIWVVHKNVTKVTLVLSTATASIQAR